MEIPPPSFPRLIGLVTANFGYRPRLSSVSETGARRPTPVSRTQAASNQLRDSLPIPWNGFKSPHDGFRTFHGGPCFRADLDGGPCFRANPAAAPLGGPPLPGRSHDGPVDPTTTSTAFQVGLPSFGGFSSSTAASIPRRPPNPTTASGLLPMPRTVPSSAPSHRLSSRPGVDTSGCSLLHRRPPMAPPLASRSGPLRPLLRTLLFNRVHWSLDIRRTTMEHCCWGWKGLRAEIDFSSVF